MYYDVRRQTGIVLAAEIRTPVPKYQGLLKLRAEVLQQLQQDRFVAQNASITSSRFGVPGYRLSADTLTFDVSASSTSKGETALDTMRNLEAMGVDCFIVRHADNGAVAALAAGARPATAFINAGDGRSAHPTQGLLDMYTIRHFKRDFTGLTVAVAVGRDGQPNSGSSMTML